MEKISWNELLKNEVLHGVKEKNVLNTIERRKANRIVLILRRNSLLKQVIE
jgi:hypothetical protein